MDKRKTDIISIIAIVISIILSIIILLKDDISDYRLMKNKRYSLKEDIRKNSITLEREKNKAAGVLDMEKEVKGQNLFITKDKLVPYLINYVSILARRHRVEIVSLEPGSSIGDNTIRKTSFTAEITGGFPNAYNFLYHLEDDWRGVKIDSLLIDKDPENNSVNVRLKLIVLSLDKNKEDV